jgi:hypothetical protein
MEFSSATITDTNNGYGRDRESSSIILKAIGIPYQVESDASITLLISAPEFIQRSVEVTYMHERRSDFTDGFISRRYTIKPGSVETTSSGRLRITLGR